MIACSPQCVWAQCREDWTQQVYCSPVPWQMYIPRMFQKYKVVTVCTRYAGKLNWWGKSEINFEKMKNIKKNWCSIIFTFPLQMLVCLFFSPLPIPISLPFSTLSTVTREKYALIDTASSQLIKSTEGLCVACDIIQHISWCMRNTKEK